MTRRLSAAAEQAKEIRAELKKAFPGVKFSVTTDNYSGGSSIHVKWVDFPTEKAVKAIASQYESVDRDQFGDILSGGNRFIFCDNKWTDETRALIEKEMPEGIERNDSSYYYWLTQAADRVWETMQAEQAPAEEETPAETPAPVEGVTVSLNDEMNGVEIRFAEKPAAGMIEMLKENGFRWSKRGFWYAKQTPERIKLARALSETRDASEAEPEVAAVEESQPDPQPTKAAKVIQFPGINRGSKQPEYTPEQQLKLEVVRGFIGDKVDDGLKEGMTPDEMFSALAVALSESSQVH